MAKPTVLPEWNSDGSNRVTPSSGQQDSGWAVDQVPPSSYFNWWMYYVYAWILWLDGIFPSNNLTLDVDKSVTVSGTGTYKHGNIALGIPAGAGISPTWAFIYATGGGAANAWSGSGVGTGAGVLFALPLKVGDRIKEVRARVTDTSSFTLTMHLLECVPNTSTQIGSTQTSSGAGLPETLALTGLTTTVATNTYYYVLVQTSGATNTTAKVYGVEVTYDRP